MNSTKTLFFTLIIFFISMPAYAYFDPGTAALIIQSIMAFLAAVIVYLGYPYRIMKKIFSNIKEKIKREQTKKTKDI
jgi:hypothetical protein